MATASRRHATHRGRMETIKNVWLAATFCWARVLWLQRHVMGCGIVPTCAHAHTGRWAGRRETCLKHGLDAGRAAIAHHSVDVDLHVSSPCPKTQDTHTQLPVSLLAGMHGNRLSPRRCASSALRMGSHTGSRCEHHETGSSWPRVWHGCACVQERASYSASCGPASTRSAEGLRCRSMPRWSK